MAYKYFTQEDGPDDPFLIPKTAAYVNSEGDLFGVDSVEQTGDGCFTVWAGEETVTVDLEDVDDIDELWAGLAQRRVRVLGE